MYFFFLNSMSLGGLNSSISQFISPLTPPKGKIDTLLIFKSIHLPL